MQAERQLPQDLDSERALLGAMLMRDYTDGLAWDFGDIRAIIQPAAFYTPAHATRQH